MTSDLDVDLRNGRLSDSNKYILQNYISIKIHQRILTQKMKLGLKIEQNMHEIVVTGH